MATWKIKHIFDGDYGCEERDSEKRQMVSVTLVNEAGEERYETVADAWLLDNHLDVGSEWPDYGGVIIYTEDLILKKAREEDLEDIYHALWRHAESARYMLWEPTETEEAARERMERTIAFQKTNKYALFIYEKASGKAIGFVGMKELEPGVWEDIGLALGPDYVGKGYGTQVLNAVVEEARRAGAKKFIASCREQNVASHNLQVKCGFTFVWREDRVDPRDGKAYVLEFSEKILQNGSV